MIEAVARTSGNRAHMSVLGQVELMISDIATLKNSAVDVYRLESKHCIESIGQCEQHDVVGSIGAYAITSGCQNVYIVCGLWLVRHPTQRCL